MGAQVPGTFRDEMITQARDKKMMALLQLVVVLTPKMTAWPDHEVSVPIPGYVSEYHSWIGHSCATLSGTASFFNVSG